MFRTYFWGWYTCYIACVCFVYQNTSRIDRRQITTSKRSTSYIRSLLKFNIHIVKYIMSRVFYKMLIVGYFYEQELSLNIICTRYCMWS